MQVWQQVKAANPGFSICEIGATIGRMWRELSDEEKQRHMEDFTKDKVSVKDSGPLFRRSTIPKLVCRSLCISLPKLVIYL